MSALVPGGVILISVIHQERYAGMSAMTRHRTVESQLDGAARKAERNTRRRQALKNTQERTPVEQGDVAAEIHVHPGQHHLFLAHQIELARVRWREEG
jgi:hypothetical protein